MNPYRRAETPKIENFLTLEDLQSLDNLTKIASKQLIDITDNGTISKPYEESLSASAWRTTLYLSGTAGNSDDIPKIKKLMNRALCGYFQGGVEIKDKLISALSGLENLQIYYRSKNKSKVCDSIEKIMDFVKTSIQFIKELVGTNRGQLINNSNYLKLNHLEASRFEIHRKYDDQSRIAAFEAVEYYRARIKLYLTLEIDSISTDDECFLRNIDHCLENSLAINISGKEFKKRIEEKLNSSSSVSLYKVIENKQKENLQEQIIRFLNELPLTDQSQIGILIPLNWGWFNEVSDFEAHPFIVSLFKQSDGTYLVAQINAGDLALGEVVKTNLHLNRNAPVTTSIIPVVEFGSLTLQETEKFLKNIINVTGKVSHLNRESAEEKYKKIFEPLLYKKSRNKRIPSRRSFISGKGNYGIKNIKEWMIYIHQKAGRINLANDFLTYVDPRGTETLAFEKVEPLLK